MWWRTCKKCKGNSCHVLDYSMNQTNRQTRIDLFSVSNPKGKRSLVIRIRICDSRLGLKNGKISLKHHENCTHFSCICILCLSVLFECWFISEGTKKEKNVKVPYLLLLLSLLFQRISFRLLFSSNVTFFSPFTLEFLVVSLIDLSCVAC